MPGLKLEQLLFHKVGQGDASSGFTLALVLLKDGAAGSYQVCLSLGSVASALTLRCLADCAVSGLCHLPSARLGPGGE